MSSQSCALQLSFVMWDAPSEPGETLAKGGDGASLHGVTVLIPWAVMWRSPWVLCTSSFLGVSVCSHSVILCILHSANIY